GLAEDSVRPRHRAVGRRSLSPIRRPPASRGPEASALRGRPGHAGVAGAAARIRGALRLRSTRGPRAADLAGSRAHPRVDPEASERSGADPAPIVALRPVVAETRARVPRPTPPRLEPAARRRNP